MANVQSKTARIQGVSIKQTSAGDIYVVKIGEGRENEYSTFNLALANQAKQLIGQGVDLRFTEKTVQKDGRTFINRYYEGAEPQLGGFGNGTAGGTFDQPSDMRQLEFPTAPTETESDRGLRIMRQTATKVAAILMPYLPENERTPSGLLAMSEFLLGYYRDGVPAPTYGTPGATFDAPLPDDDIPF